MTKAAPFFTLTRNFVKMRKNMFFLKILKKRLMTDLTRNLISCGPYSWASVAKFASKSDYWFLSYRDDMGGTFFYIKTQFRKKRVFQKILQKKLESDLTQNRTSSGPCPWASVAKFSAKSDNPFLS